MTSASQTLRRPDELIAAGRARASEFSPRMVASRYAALAEVWAKR